MSLRFSIQRKQWTSLWRFHQSNACKIQIKCSSSLLRALSRSLWKSSHGDFEVLQVKFFMVKRERVFCFESYFASSSSINFLIKAGFSIRSSFASEKNLVSPYKETGSCWGTQTVSYHVIKHDNIEHLNSTNLHYFHFSSSSKYISIMITKKKKSLYRPTNQR